MATTRAVLTLGAADRTGCRVSALLEKHGIGTERLPDFAAADAAAAVARLTELARTPGLERIVLLCGRGEPGAQRAEATLRQSAVPWTIVRAGWLDQSFSEGYLLDGVLAGEVALPAGAVPEPFVDADDAAAVVVAALSGQRHANQLYDVTGPRALTFAQAVAEIAATVGRPIRYTRISPEDFVVSMRAYASEDVVQLMHERLTVVLDGRNSRVTDAVATVLGRPARDFSEYVRRTAATGVWNA